MQQSDAPTRCPMTNSNKRRHRAPWSCSKNSARRRRGSQFSRLLCQRRQRGRARCTHPGHCQGQGALNQRGSTNRIIPILLRRCYKAGGDTEGGDGNGQEAAASPARGVDQGESLGGFRLPVRWQAQGRRRLCGQARTRPQADYTDAPGNKDGSTNIGASRGHTPGAREAARGSNIHSRGKVGPLGSS